MAVATTTMLQLVSKSGVGSKLVPSGSVTVDSAVVGTKSAKLFVSQLGLQVGLDLGLATVNGKSGFFKLGRGRLGGGKVLGLVLEAGRGRHNEVAARQESENVTMLESLLIQKKSKPV